VAKKNKLSGVVPGRKPLTPRQVMEKGLADLELRSDIDPYMNDLARLGWDIATRGKNQDDPKRQGLAATIVTQSLRDAGIKNRKRTLGRTYPTSFYTKPEDTREIESEYENQVGRPVKKDMSLLYLAGQEKDYPRGEDLVTLLHELTHLGSMYLSEQGLVDRNSPIYISERNKKKHEDFVRKIVKQTREKLTKEPSVIESLLDMLSIKDFQESRVDVPITRREQEEYGRRREWNADRRISDDVVEEAYNLARSSLRERGLPPEVKYKGLASLGEK
jgi:hypothetical protein